MIQKATLSDIPAILEIEKESYAKPWSDELFIKAVESSDKVVFINRTNEGITGFVVFENVADEGHITDIAVSKKCREKGIGSELIGKAVTYAKDHDLNVIFLEVRQSNDAAKKLYAKFNFKQIAQRKDYYKSPNENAVVYELRLSKNK